MKGITKARREWFGALVYTESPGMTVWVDQARADALGVPTHQGLRPGLYSAPLDVHIALTTRCQLRCPGCYALLEDPGRDMDPALARRIIDRLADLKVFTLSFGGGEPTLHPALFELAAYARQRQIAPNLTTNGMGLDDKSAGQYRCFSSIHLSYHRAEDLPNLERAAGALRRAGIRPGLNLLLTRMTFCDLDAILGWSRAAGVQRVLFQQFKTTRRNAVCGEQSLLPEQRSVLFATLRRLCRRHGIMPLMDCSLFPLLAATGVSRRDLAFFDVTGCQGGNAYVAVDVEGLVRPCSFWPEAMLAAAELDRETWVHHPGLVDFRQTQPAACRGCSLADLCGSPCRLPDFIPGQDGTCWRG